MTMETTYFRFVSQTSSSLGSSPCSMSLAAEPPCVHTGEPRHRSTQQKACIVSAESQTRGMGCSQAVPTAPPVSTEEHVRESTLTSPPPFRSFLRFPASVAPMYKHTSFQRGISCICVYSPLPASPVRDVRRSAPVLHPPSRPHPPSHVPACACIRVLVCGSPSQPVPAPPPRDVRARVRI